MKILVAEDDRHMLELITQTLRTAQFTVDTALDGRTALEKIKTRKYDLVVLDIKLPEVNGFDIIAQVRMLGIETPILVLSSCTLIEDKVKGLNLGADDYMTKHFAPEELIARAKRLFRTQCQTRRNVVKCRDLVLNLDDMSVHRQGKRIHLSKKELGILMQLVKKKDSIVSRDEIIHAVWGERDIPVTSNTIDVHIRTLRSKVDRPFTPKHKPLVETVRGYGYAMYSTKKT